ncbi:MAG: hypothetical protein HRU13_02315 [Phycisphaerales bacterium]|nr:hypothetical protein [Phycisphaerales bacterium]
MARRTTSGRRGAAYIVALLAGTIVTITGLAALSVSTTQARTAAIEDRLANARLNAHSAIEYGKAAVSAHLADGGTRTDLFGTINPGWNYTGGRASWRLREIGGATLNNIDGPVVLEATGESGVSTFRYDAILAPSGIPLDVLEMGMYAGGIMEFSSGAGITSEDPIGSAALVDNDAAIVNADVESAGNITGATYLGSTTRGVAPRILPDSALFAYYQSIGETIALSDLTWRSNSYWLENTLLSPNSNPFGSTNPLGIYVIDCQSQWVSLANVRVVGTLVLLNATNSIWIHTRTLVQPAYPWMPSLLVQGDAGFYAGDVALSEATAGVNLNPRGTPYLFESDGDTSDSYPSEIQGLIYVSDDVQFYLPSQTIHGKLIVGDTIQVRSGVDVDIFDDPDIERYPPFGFFEDTGGLVLDPNTITWTMP